MEKGSDRNWVTIKLLGFDDADKACFSSILTLAERALTKNWSITQEPSADFFLIKESLIPLMDSQELLKSIPRRQCIFIRRKPDDYHSEGHQFYWGEGNVPSLRLLAEFLNRVADELPASSASPEPVSTAVSEADFFDPEQGFLGRLLVSTSHPRQFRLPRRSPKFMLYVDSRQQCYYSNAALKELTPFFFAADNELQVENLSNQQLQTAVANQALNVQPLNHLLWFAAFSCSQGKVIKGYQKDDNVYLKRWPNLNLPDCRRLVKVAAYMQSNAVNLDTVQANTGIPIEQLYNFYNACQVTNLIGHSQRMDTHNKQLDSDQKQLLAKIIRRLNKENNNKKE